MEKEEKDQSRGGRDEQTRKRASFEGLTKKTSYGRTHAVDDYSKGLVRPACKESRKK